MIAREYFVKVVGGINVVPAQPGKVPDYNAVEFPCNHVIYHSGEVRTSEVSAAEAIIKIGVM